MSQHFQQNGNNNNGPILPMINRNVRKPFRRMASWTKNNGKSSAIGCICLLISNTVFLILAIIFAVLYFNRGNQNGSDGTQFGGGPNGDFSSSKLANWNAPTTSLFGQYSQAAVAADQEICSNIGRGILLKGGNAVDAAIATQFCIGIMDTHSAGLGGGHLMTIFNATTKTCHVVDAREIAPLNSTEDMFVGIGREGKSEKGWESIAVPGEIHGYWTEYTNFGGNVDWNSLVEPTINLVQEGYPTSHALAGYLKSKREQILARPSMAKRFVNPETGNMFLPGEQIKTRPDLVETLKKLANAADPVELFYRGELAKSMVDEFKINGGRLTLDDFANYKAKIRNDSQVIYTRLSGGRTICGPPPPSGSAVTHAIINILDTIPFDLSTFSGRVEYLHHYIEASRFAYAARNQLGDMDFVPEALELAKNITSQEWAKYIRSKITWGTHVDEYYDEGIPREFQEDHGTAHVSIVDKWGNAVAITSSLNLAFGSMEFSDSTGILWNDQMDDFSTPGKSNYWGYPPSSKNFIRPGKRPMSSMSPIIVFNEKSKEVLAIGGSGGSTIISGVAEATYNALWLGMSIKEAIDFPRLHNQLRPNITVTERRMPPKEYLDALAQRGHRFAPSKEGAIFNVVSGVHRLEDGTIRANSDFRKGWESQPVGY